MKRRQDKTTRSGVYFFRCGRSVKIGFAADIFKRLKSLQTGSPSPIFCVGWFETNEPRQVEQDLHERFAKHHRRGEWFDWCDEIKEYCRWLQDRREARCQA